MWHWMERNAWCAREVNGGTPCTADAGKKKAVIDKDELRRMLTTVEVADEYFGWTNLALWQHVDRTIPWQIEDVCTGSCAARIPQ
jgi:hypothetical protein